MLFTIRDTFLLTVACAVVGAGAASAEKVTRSTGAPVGDNLDSETAGPLGPTLLQDNHLIEKLAHFDRECIPERVVHARGVVAKGNFKARDSRA